MGREFGNLTRIRHVISYSLSPFEQRAFPHYFSKGIPNVLRRTRERILRVAPRECGAGGVLPRAPFLSTSSTDMGFLSYRNDWPKVTWVTPASPSEVIAVHHQG